MSVRDVRHVDPAEAEEAAAVVCVRVADAPSLPIEDQGPWASYMRMVQARSSIEPCAACSEPVYVDSISPKKPPRVCIECAATIFGGASKNAS